MATSGARWLVALLALLWAGWAAAHEMTMAELEMRELSKGEFVWGGDRGRRIARCRTTCVVWPDGCVTEEQALHCAGDDGLSGLLSVEGVGRAYSAAMIRITWLDGRQRVYTLTSAQPGVRLFGAVDDRRGAFEIVRAYTVLGIEHILTGIDHLLFVMGLLFLVGFNRRLVATITAFTLAHSLTLASSALGWLTLRSPPVEATIALSIVLVAAEALHRRDTLARRWPALVAFGFGLVHGLGFAGALKEIGLPPEHYVIALLTFNVGVEIGQLLSVSAALLVVRLLSRFPWFVAARKPALYLIGTTAAYWSWLRIAAIAG